MIVPFWNNECKEFSKQLWKPKDDIEEALFDDPSWKCDNEKISFKMYLPIEITNIDLDFKPVEIKENLFDKRKIFFGKFNVEITRLEKKIDKNKIKDNIVKKHLASIKKIQNDSNVINNVTMKHKNYFVKIGKELISLKKKFEKIDKKDKCYSIIEQHFEQTEKIYFKMQRLDDIIYCKKVNILFNVGQINIVNSWYSNTVEIYNDLVKEYNEIHNKIKKSYEKTDKKIRFGKYLATKLKENINFPSGARKLRDVKIHSLTEKYDLPFCLIADTILQFSSNLKGNLTKIQKGDINDFNFKYKKYSKVNKTIPIQQKYTSVNGFYPTIFGSIETDEVDFDWKSICSDYNLIYNQYHKTWNLHIPSYRQHRESPFIREPFASLDPGMRAFQQLYGLNHIVAVGENLYGPIMEKINKIESMERKLKLDRDTRKEKKVRNIKSKKLSRSSRINIRKAITRTHIKIKDIVTELHNKLCIYLCESYDRIMVTDFSSKKVNGKHQNLQPNHKKVLGKLSHYTFRQRRVSDRDPKSLGIPKNTLVFLGIPSCT